MDLTSDHAYWTLRNGLQGVYAPLAGDVKCDVAVLGAGISGALAADALSLEGHSVAVFDKRDAGWGSTGASTAMLQYEIDTHLHDLAEQYGEEMAARAYRACYDAVDQLGELVRNRCIECGFERVPSVYFASRPEDADALRKEADARTRARIPVEYWSAGDIASRFPFSHPAALFSEQAAQVDPYRLTHGLLQAVEARGGRVHDRTEITSIEATPQGVRLSTGRGCTIEAQRLVVAAGYESVSAFPVKKLVSLRSTYAVASEPLTEPEPWWRKALLWESARPYFYLRSTADNRVIMGGEDIPFRNPPARDRQLKKKGAALAERFGEWFPSLAWEPAYCWAGTFGETKDGLAYIGEHPEHPRCLFALGFGGNGIIYSVIAAQTFAALLGGKPAPFGKTFGFDR